jgi:hypothetical protein
MGRRARAATAPTRITFLITALHILAAGRPLGRIACGFTPLEPPLPGDGFAQHISTLQLAKLAKSQGKGRIPAPGGDVAEGVPRADPAPVRGARRVPGCGGRRRARLCGPAGPQIGIGHGGAQHRLRQRPRHAPCLPRWSAAVRVLCPNRLPQPGGAIFPLERTPLRRTSQPTHRADAHPDAAAAYHPPLPPTAVSQGCPRLLLPPDSPIRSPTCLSRRSALPGHRLSLCTRRGPGPLPCPRPPTDQLRPWGRTAREVEQLSKLVDQ